MAISSCSLENLGYSSISQEKLKTAKLLQNKLSKDTRVQYEPLIPPKNDKRDFEFKIKAEVFW